MIATPRFLVALLPLGTKTPMSSAMRATVALGHIPVDLVGTGLLELENWDPTARYLESADYLIVFVGSVEDLEADELKQAERAFDLAVERGIPVLTLLPRRWTEPEREDGSGMTLFQKLGENTFGMTSRYEGVDTELAQTMGRFFSTFTRPGYISSNELPGRNVAEQLANLVGENQELRRLVGEGPGEAERRRREEVVRLLQENRIVIPLWYRGASGWGQPVEMALYDFFLRMGPELAAEVSTEAAAEFIPVGVCGLEREDFRARWPVPSNNLNLWFTDLMAIGVVEPSLRKRRSKDAGQYWTLTEEGRRLLSDIRRSVLSDGGHRHIGFTSEFRIVQDVDADV